MVQQRIAEKRAFYRREGVAGNYDAQRFAGASGSRVDRREQELVLSLIPRGGLIADVGSGTGRIARALLRVSSQVIAFDTSLPMLNVGVAQGTWPAAQGDAFCLPIASDRCDGATAIRLLFHFHDLLPLLTELRRIVRPGGVLVCDTYVWTPRAVLPLGAARWGAKVWTLRSHEFTTIARATGWRVREMRTCFLFSPFLYGRLPLVAQQLLERLERSIPWACCRCFWSLEAVS